MSSLAIYEVLHYSRLDVRDVLSTFETSGCSCIFQHPTNKKSTDDTNPALYETYRGIYAGTPGKRRIHKSFEIILQFRTIGSNAIVGTRVHVNSSFQVVRIQSRRGRRWPRGPDSTNDMFYT